MFSDNKPNGISKALTTVASDSLIQKERIVCTIHGYSSTVDSSVATTFESIPLEYVEDQRTVNDIKADKWLLPLLRRLGAHRVLDAGCGVGQTVERLREHGFDAYGYDLLENVPFWQRLNRATDRYIITAPVDPIIPLADGAVDGVFSFGVIEHVGTSDGKSTRLADYHEIRRRWTSEMLRVVRPGGFLMLAGPNRCFPIDTAHGPDAAASHIETWFARKAGLTLHRTWGPNFLWSYSDVERYVDGKASTIEALSVHNLMFFSRVPWPFKFLAEKYVQYLPAWLRKSGFNPWMAALITK